MRRGFTLVELLVVTCLVGIVVAIVLACVGCDVQMPPAAQPKSSSGVSRATTHVDTNADGKTVEQQNIIDRLKVDNLHGSIKHLYIISAYSGQTLIYSTVKGKVTSSGKRLSPNSVSSDDGEFVDDDYHGVSVQVGNRMHRTTETLQDDGTYGSSIEYLFWFDSKGVYHQHYVQGGQIVHVSDQPLNVGSVVLNLETKAEKE